MKKILTLVFGSVFTLFMTKAWGSVLPADNNQTSPWIKVLSNPDKPGVLNIPQLMSPTFIQKPIYISANSILFEAGDGIIKYNRKSHKYSAVKGAGYLYYIQSGVVLNSAYTDNTLYVFGKNYLFSKQSDYGKIKDGVIWINKWSLYHGFESGVSSIQRTQTGGVSFLYNRNSSHPYLYACTKTVSNCRKVVERRVVAYTWGRSGALYYIPYKGDRNILITPTSSMYLSFVNWPSDRNQMYYPLFVSLGGGKFMWYNTVFNIRSKQSEAIECPSWLVGYPEFWFNNHLYIYAREAIYEYTRPL